MRPEAYLAITPNKHGTISLCLAPRIIFQSLPVYRRFMTSFFNHIGCWRRSLRMISISRRRFFITMQFHIHSMITKTFSPITTLYYHYGPNNTKGWCMRSVPIRCPVSMISSSQSTKSMRRAQRKKRPTPFGLRMKHRRLVSPPRRPPSPRFDL